MQSMTPGARQQARAPARELRRGERKRGNGESGYTPCVLRSRIRSLLERATVPQTAQNGDAESDTESCWSWSYPPYPSYTRRSVRACRRPVTCAILCSKKFKLPARFFWDTRRPMNGLISCIRYVRTVHMLPVNRGRLLVYIVSIYTRLFGRVMCVRMR
jgi:hypothetical protein